MPRKSLLSANEKNLIRRYLVWCYKTTKEDLDRIDRYFTQFVADNYILNQLKKAKVYKTDPDFVEAVHAFEDYKDEKMAKADKEKFSNSRAKALTGEYLYLSQRFSAIEETIKNFLGVAELKNITKAYEDEMTKRILEAREHS